MKKETIKKDMFFQRNGGSYLIALCYRGLKVMQTNVSVGTLLPQAILGEQEG